MAHRILESRRGRRVSFFALSLALASCGGKDPSSSIVASNSATQSNTASVEAIEAFDVHVGDPFLQALGFPAGDVARASNGDTIKVVFTGEIDPKESEAKGKGTFEHRNSRGALLASGTFRAKELLRFTDFGTEADVPPTFHGGTALIHVRVKGHPAANPATTVRFEADLGVDCKIGNFPKGFEEGITFDAHFINFNKKVSGVTVFLAEED